MKEYLASKHSLTCHPGDCPTRAQKGIWHFGQNPLVILVFWGVALVETGDFCCLRRELHVEDPVRLRFNCFLFDDIEPSCALSVSCAPTFFDKRLDDLLHAFRIGLKFFLLPLTFLKDFSSHMSSSSSSMFSFYKLWSMTLKTWSSSLEICGISDTIQIYRHLALKST